MITKREKKILACCEVLKDDRYKDDRKLQLEYINKIIDLIYKKI